MARFALDRNFPVQIISDVWPPSIELVPLGAINPAMTAWDDWQIITELDRLGGYDGLITDDGDMLALRNEMVALTRTSLSLIIADAAGDNPIEATGPLMMYLTNIIQSRPAAAPSIFVLSVDEVGRKQRKVYDQIRRIARQENLPEQDMVRAARRETDAWLLTRPSGQPGAQA